MLKRIVINSCFAAFALAVMGVLLSEMAITILNKPIPNDTATLTGHELSARQLRTRLPLLMAGGGVILVVVGELLAFAIRGKPREPKPPVPPGPSAEKLLEDLLKQVENAENAKKADV